MAEVDTAHCDLGLGVDVEIEHAAWERALDDPAALCASAATAAYNGVPGAPAPALVSVMLGDDGAVAALNSAFRSKNGPTNVLSFPSGDVWPDGRVMLGDIAVAFETVERESAAAGVALADHLAHMIVHGTLHLLGFDHEADAEADEMERLETVILGGLGIADPYAGQAAEVLA